MIVDEQLSLDEESAKLRHDARETSRLAALKMAPASKTIRKSVLEVIHEAGTRGLTDDEISGLLQISPNTTRPRRLELVEGGWVSEGERAAVSAYGNKAIAWVATGKTKAFFRSVQ